MKNEFQAPHVVNLSIPDKNTLYAAYMPWLKHGGLFFASRADHKLHQEVLLSIDLLNGNEKFTVTGQVVWITPRGAGKRAAGIGVQFASKDEGVVRNKIDAILAGVDTSRRTHTM